MISTSRVAIVTGAAQGIGLAIALRLADDGLDVAINDIPSKSEAIDQAVQAVKAKGRKAIAIPGDVSSEEDVKNMIGKTASELGSLDVMVANAGLLLLKPLLDTSVEEFEQIMNVNSRGMMLCFKYAAVQMIKQGKGGRIIGASSAAGKKGMPALVAYSMSKFSVRGLIQSFSQELKGHNILVNGYSPGAIQTNMAPINKLDIGANPQEMVGLSGTPIGQPENIASIVSYLIKPESEFINGQTITVDGGVIYD